jgi:ribosomal protein L11 methyltransferase
LIRLAVRCRAAEAELVLAQLAVLAPNGVEEEQGTDYVEYAIYGGEGELPDLGSLRAAVGEHLVEVVATEVPDDWADRWQDFHKPLLVGGRIWLRPSWERPRSDAIDIVVDPGRAFGTGAHPTTRLCLELMLDLAAAGRAEGPLSDLGTGSGVLAIAAAKLGWRPVAGFDREQAAIEAAAANASLNEVELDLQRLDLRESRPAPAPTVVANLTAPLLRGLAETLGAGAPPRRLICSGLLRTEADQVGSWFVAAGLNEEERRASGDWASISFAAA